ncbi:cytochrome C [Blautia sp. AF19-34]|nr:cytochrome C [Blautia sp. AF19-34]
MEDYNKLCEDRTYGRIFTPDGLRMICEANNYDPEAIGKQMLETYAKFKSKGVFGCL